MAADQDEQFAEDMEIQDPMAEAEKLFAGDRQ